MRLIVATVLLALTLGAAGCSYSNSNTSTEPGSGEATQVAADKGEATQAAAGEGDAVTPVLVSLVGGDTAAFRGSDGRYYVVYELLLTNASSDPASLDAVEVLDAADGTEVLKPFPAYAARSFAATRGRGLACHQRLLQAPDPRTFTLENLGDGNSVVIDHGNGFYSTYAHLQLGSVEVEVGDRVQAGDRLALLGNSGNSDAPHLHFYVTTSPSLIASDGFPYVLDSFLLAAEPDDVEAAAQAAEDTPSLELPSRAELSPIEHKNELPLENSMVDFPDR